MKVRQAWTARGGLAAPKSRHGRRDVPLPQPLVHELREHVKALKPPPPGEKAWAFPSARGTISDTENLRRRVLDPAMQEAGSNLGFHGFRHAFASMHIEAGTNVVQLSRLLGHHAPSFTLDVYGSLMDRGVGDPLDLDAELAPYALLAAARGGAVTDVR